MYELILTQGKKTLVDEDIYATLCNTKWQYANGYALRRIKNETEYLHHLLMPKKHGYVVDHINQNSLDNRRMNLRYATKSGNATNSKNRQGTSLFKGVSWDNQMQKWRASINILGKRSVVGLFEQERHAAMAYDIAARDIYGEFSSLNFNLSV